MVSQLTPMPCTKMFLDLRLTGLAASRRLLPRNHFKASAGLLVAFVLSTHRSRAMVVAAAS